MKIRLINLDFGLLLIIFAGFLLVVLSLGSEITEGNTITVDDDGGKDYKTIQEAIDNASIEDTIFVYNGTYKENVIINKTITLRGEDKYNTTCQSKVSVTRLK